MPPLQTLVPRLVALVAIALLAGRAGPAAGAAPKRSRADGGWNQYGGPQRDNRSAETGLLASWPDGGPAVAATARNLGIGYSSVSFGPATVLTMGSRGDDELVICLDADSLEEKWATRIGRSRADGMGGGPRATPTVDGDRVYALGANGDLACLSLADGKPLWGGNILQVFGATNIVWGISESPLVDGDRVVVTPGGQEGTIVALEKRTGKPLWRAVVPGTPQAGYSSIVVVESAGVRQYVNFVHSGVVGIRATDGQVLWGDDASANATANCSSPVVWKGNVFSASGYGTGGALLRLARAPRGGVAATLAYRTKEMKNHHGGMVVDGDWLYGTDEGVLKCLEVASGRVMWENRSVGKGAVVWADGKLVLRAEEGDVALVEATPRAYVELGRFTPEHRSDRPAWPHPVIAGGRLWLRDQDTLTAYSIAE